MSAQPRHEDPPSPARARRAGLAARGARRRCRRHGRRCGRREIARDASFSPARRRLLGRSRAGCRAFVRPDHLTVLALGRRCFAVFAATGHFWTAGVLLVVHWFGDSLDGTLARVRRAERPRYGYYLDHFADAVATALVGSASGCRRRCTSWPGSCSWSRTSRCRSTRTWRRRRSGGSRSATGGSARPRRGWR